MLRLNNFFIREHIDELVELEDYVPVSFVPYDKQHDRDKFLKSKKLLRTMREMDELVRLKCNHHEDSVKAYDSVLIEWLDLHPEFEDIISDESFEDYKNMKSNNDFIEFIDLLDVGLSPGFNIEKIRLGERNISIEDMSIKEDSGLRLPDFDKIDKIYEDYPNTLLADYLSYLV